MTVTEGLQRVSGAAARRPRLTLALITLLALAGGGLATRLRPSAATDTFVSASSPAYRATAQEQRQFGSDAVVVLVRAPLTALLAPAALATQTRLEACLAGQTVAYDATLRAEVPVSGHGAYGGAASPCGALAASRAALVVYGPGTFLNRAVAAINGEIAASVRGARAAGEAAARAAYRLALARGASRHAALLDAAAALRLEDVRQLAALESEAAGSGLATLPSIRSGPFVHDVVFGSSGAATTPRARFAYLFPGSGSALVEVRLRASLSGAARARAIALIRRAVAMPQFAPPAGGSYVVSGVPVVLTDLAGTITGAIGLLLAAAVLAMAAALLVVFRRPLRLLPLGVALAATGITFGVLALLGVTLTLASVAVLPVLIGLAVDYGIQFQSRAGEEEGKGEEGQVRAAVAGATAGAAPAILTAALATLVGFLVLLLSPVPMVRGFGIVLVAGIVVALACTLTAVPAALVLRAGEPQLAPAGGDTLVLASLRGAGELLGAVPRAAARGLAPALRGASDLLRVAGETLLAALRGAGELLRGASLRAGALPAGAEPRLERALRGLTRHPLRVLALGLVLAAAGWVADGHTAVQSDVTKLVPQSMPALRDLRTLEASTGVSGEIDVAVRGRDVATPATLRWMSAYQGALLRHFGYGADGSCVRATLCPELSLPDLFQTTSGQAASLTQARIDELLQAVPAYFASAVLTSDRRAATLAFGIRLMPLARQQRVIEYMRAHLHPPAGVSAALTGLPVLAAQADASLASPSRRLLTLAAGLAAVGLVLLLVLRRPGRALLPMVPIVLATGWSALVLYLLGIPLNPMSATLGTLVIAISTEFSVLLAERFRAERGLGHPPALALARTYRSTGRAVLASGVTAIVGFGVLVVSDITMLRDFGLVTLIDLTVSLGGVLVVLPAALALAGPRPGVAPRRARGRPWARRGARVA